MNMFNLLLMAGTQQGSNGNSGMTGIWMMILVILIFYFFMIRPQQKRAKKEKEFREQLSKGDDVVTISGLHGKVKEVKETTVFIEIAHDVVVEVEKSAISMTTNPTQTKK